MKKQKKIIVSIIVSLVTLGGCTPTRVSDEVKLNAPENWNNQPETANSKADLKRWWQGFRDSILNDLIAQALLANHDLKIAKKRINEVKALATVAESALYPSIDLFASGGREKRIDRILGVPGSRGIELITPTGDSANGGLSARWEIDLFGGRQLDKEAVLAQALGAEEALKAVQVGLLAQVASSYFALQGVQERQNIQQKIVDVNREKLRALLAFHRAGLATNADVKGQEALLSSSAAVLPMLKQSASALVHRLSVLIGKPPAALEAKLSNSQPTHQASPLVPALMPAELLTQRPDLRMAKTEVTSAAAKLGSARADLLPKIQLAASAGFGAIAVGGFPGLAESVYTLGTGLTAPIFNAGRIEAYISAADSRLQQAATNYEKAFLLAMEDVENAYVAYRSATEQSKDFTTAETSATGAYEQKLLLYSKGVVNYLALLDAQKDQLTLTDEKAKAETAIRVGLISLYRAFGGGWCY